MGNKTLFDRAVRLYRRRAEREGFMARQPDSGSGFTSRTEPDVFELYNRNGTLARFRYDRQADRLRFIHDGD